MSVGQSKGQGLTAGRTNLGIVSRALLLILMLGFAGNTVLTSMCAIQDAAPSAHSALVDVSEPSFNTEVEGDQCCASCSNCALGGSCCAQAGMPPDTPPSIISWSLSALTADAARDLPDQLSSDLLRVPITA